MSNKSSVRIYLCGFMGSGKSTVGRLLSKQLDWPFKDLDEVIEAAVGKSIPRIFQEKGEEYFRGLENRKLRELSTEDPPFVLATGGGVPVNPENVEIICNTGTALHLKVSPEVAYERIKGDDHRPNLGEFDEFKELWSSRQEAYNSLPYSIEVDRRNPQEVVNKILEILDV